MQIVGLSCMLFRLDFLGLPVYAIGLGLTLVATILTLWSMVLYLRLAWPELRGSSSR
jgi:CDP-diacylglycerol--glycerol-3-phosphate 3-phosphatidyltransferase/cardiolipin synthase